MGGSRDYEINYEIDLRRLNILAPKGQLKILNTMWKHLPGSELLREQNEYICKINKCIPVNANVAGRRQSASGRQLRVSRQLSDFFRQKEALRQTKQRLIKVCKGSHNLK